MNLRGFDFAQLRTLVAVAQAGSVSAAAERIFLSQSSVSEQLKKLEDRVGQPLFVRSKQGVAATPAGVKLLAHAERILALSEAAFDDMQGRALDGELRIAITDYYRPHEIALVLRRFSEQHPRLKLHVTVLPSAVIDSSADDNTFDIGLSLRIVAPAGRTAARGGGSTSKLGKVAKGSTVVRREKLVWAASAEMDTRRMESPYRLVLLPSTCQLQRYVVKLLDERKVPYLVSHSASGVAGLQLALKAGLGISCLNESSIGAGLVACGKSVDLPTLPAVEFHLLPARPGESELVANARTVLRELLA